MKSGEMVGLDAYEENQLIVVIVVFCQDPKGGVLTKMMTY